MAPPLLPGPGSPPDEPRAGAEGRLPWRLTMLKLVDALYTAVRDRDEPGAAALLDRPEAGHLPRDVREEVAALVREPAASHRAPMRLLRFGFVLTQLEGREGLERDRRREAQLLLELDHEPGRLPEHERPRRRAG